MNEPSAHFLAVKAVLVSPLTGCAKSVFAVLLDHYSTKTKRAEVSLGGIAIRLGIHKPNVLNAINDELIPYGVVERHKGRSGQKTTYEINFELCRRLVLDDFEARRTGCKPPASTSPLHPDNRPETASQRRHRDKKSGSADRTALPEEGGSAEHTAFDEQKSQSGSAEHIESGSADRSKVDARIIPASLTRKRTRKDNSSPAPSDDAGARRQPSLASGAQPAPSSSLAPAQTDRAAQDAAAAPPLSREGGSGLQRHTNGAVQPAEVATEASLGPYEREIYRRYRDNGETAAPEVLRGGWGRQLREKFDALLTAPRPP